MPSPFPGMDPYLESPDIWPDVHHGLISGIRNALTPRLRPTYVARVELRVYVTDQDDPGIEVIIPYLVDDEIEIKEARLEIRHRESGSLVAIIEVMSPTNKIRGSYGRSGFMKKKREAIESGVHWIEIDLLRAGVPSVTRPPLQPSDYRVLMYRAPERRGRYWRIGVRQQLPTIGIPLRGDDADVPLNLTDVFKEVYDHGAYDLSLDYRKEPTPEFDAEDKTWADQLLREHGLR